MFTGLKYQTRVTGIPPEGETPSLKAVHGGLLRTARSLAQTTAQPGPTGAQTLREKPELLLVNVRQGMS